MLHAWILRYFYEQLDARGMGRGGSVVIIGNKSLSGFTEDKQPNKNNVRISGDSFTISDENMNRPVNPSADSTGDIKMEHGSDDEAEQTMMRVLAGRTVAALERLHEIGKLTLREKNVLTADVIEKVAEGAFSPVEIAYTLLVCGFKPGERDYAAVPENLLSTASAESVDEFAEVCRRYSETMN